MKDHWLSNRLKELGKKSRGLAQHLGVADSRITEIKKGLREIQTDELAAIATYLEWPVDEVLHRIHGNLSGAGSVTSFLKGEVQAGHWMESAHWPEDEWERMALPIPEKFRALEPFWLRVTGDSMDEVYPDGTLILCIPCRLLDRELRSGERVVAERRDRNDPVEITVKEFRSETHADGTRRWLVAKSTRPEFAGAIPLLKKETDEIHAVALVIGHFGMDVH